MVPFAATRVTAPADGTVLQVDAKEGEMTAPGQPLVVMANLTKVRVEANVEETEIAQIRPGEGADVYVDAYPGKPLTGQVKEVGLATGSVFSLIPSDNSTGNFTKVVQRIPVRVSVNNEDELLRPGMSVRVRFHLRDGVSAASR
ncbi:MAG: efflux RND transporter periplasmic adaptor subunit [Firmicutes bacterium]|nr:efflux RND transporter periplasmic adaptor subunit [Bacillota bacterium]